MKAEEGFDFAGAEGLKTRRAIRTRRRGLSVFAAAATKTGKTDLARSGNFRPA